MCEQNNNDINVNLARHPLVSKCTEYLTITQQLVDHCDITCQPSKSRFQQKCIARCLM